MWCFEVEETPTFPPLSLNRLPSNFLLIHPDILAGQAGPAEGGNEFAGRNGAGTGQQPGPKGQQTDKSAGRTAPRAQGGKGQALMALGKAFAGGVEQQGKMRVAGRGQAEEPQQGKLARRGSENVSSSATAS